MALTDQNFTIKIAKRENIEKKKIGFWNEKKYEYSESSAISCC